MAKAKKTGSSIKLPDGGGSLSKEFIASHATESEFIATMGDKTHSVFLNGDKNRDKKLKEVYALATAKPEDLKQAPAKGAKQ